MQCFTVLSNEIEDILSVEFYSPHFFENRQKIKASKFKQVKLKDISSKITKGETPLWKGDKYQEQGILFIKSENVLENEINLMNRTFIDEDVHNRMSRSQLKKGDVLLNIVGASIGRSCVYDLEEKANINQAVCLIRLNNNINPYWLSFVLNSKPFQTLLMQTKSGGARDNIDLYQVRELQIPLPPLSVQNQIVDIMQSAYQQKKQMEAEAQKLLDSIDGYVIDELDIEVPGVEEKMCFVVNSEEVQNNRVNVYYYQPKFKEVEKALVKGKYRIAKLKEFVTKIHYGVSIKNVYVDEGIPLLRILNIKPNKIYLTEVAYLEDSKRKEIGNGFVYEGDLLISRSGSVGIVAVVPKEADGFAFGSFMIKFCVNDEVNKEYVSIWLNNKISKLLTEREKIGAIQGNITISTIENFPIPLPPLKIQNKIADEVKSRISDAERLKAEAGKIIEEAKKKVEKMILGD